MPYLILEQYINSIESMSKTFKGMVSTINCVSFTMAHVIIYLSMEKCAAIVGQRPAKLQILSHQTFR